MRAHGHTHTHTATQTSTVIDFIILSRPEAHSNIHKKQKRIVTAMCGGENMWGVHAVPMLLLAATVGLTGS